MRRSPIGGIVREGLAVKGIFHIRAVLKKSGQENSRHRKLLVERSVARKSLVSPFEKRKQRPV